MDCQSLKSDFYHGNAYISLDGGTQYIPGGAELTIQPAT